MSSVTRIESPVTPPSNRLIEPTTAPSIKPAEMPSGSKSAQTLHKATALHGAGKFEEAEALLREAIKGDRGNALLWSARGVMMAGMRRSIDAMWCYREALA